MNLGILTINYGAQSIEKKQKYDAPTNGSIFFIHVYTLIIFWKIIIKKNAFQER